MSCSKRIGTANPSTRTPTDSINKCTIIEDGHWIGHNVGHALRGSTVETSIPYESTTTCRVRQTPSQRCSNVTGHLFSCNQFAENHGPSVQINSNQTVPIGTP